MIENREHSITLLAEGEAHNMREIRKLSVRGWLNLCKFRAEKANPRHGKKS